MCLQYQIDARVFLSYECLIWIWDYLDTVRNMIIHAPKYD